jgi:CRISPR-associated protein Cas5d
MGRFACFSRPESKVERHSYDVITPSAARGVLEAIYWKPQVAWVVERIHVYKEPRFTNLRRNEVASKASAANAKKAMNGSLKEPLALYADEDRQQRAATILVDVEYVIEARFELLDDSDGQGVAKHFNMFKRRAVAGQRFHHPYLGAREFPCDFEWVEGPIPPSSLGDRDFGYMLRDFAFDPIVRQQGVPTPKPESVCGHTGLPLTVTPHLFHAVMRQGVIEVPPLVRAAAVVSGG